ncbi:MAG: HAMP domain-containing protein, partial [Gemmataceae bacterium]|nr:HAMP domain-containing protein [Gemmataceae bacterium]
MASHWRIRHKLLLGLGLVLGSFTLVLTGAVQGLTSYMSTMIMSDSKLAELDDSDEFRIVAGGLLAPVDGKVEIQQEEQILRERLALAREKLAFYARRLDENIERRGDQDMGLNERALVKRINGALDQFEKSLDRARNEPELIGEGDSKRRVDHRGIAEAGREVAQLSNELRLAIYDDQHRRIVDGKKQYHRSMAMVIGTSVLGVLIMAGLLRFFYGWIFQPLHTLQEGVRRVAGGNFEGRIDLESGDELEELADAFNDMTRRLQSKYSDLTNEVAERGKQLVRSERLASVGFLAAGVAHEINNPLASIAFCSEALERRLGELLTRLPREQEAVGKYLKMIQQEAFRCKQITQNLLEFSRVGEGKRVATDLNELVTSVLEMAQHLKASEGKRAVFRPSGPMVAEVNPQEIKQVVLNMVVNAMESMDEGGTLDVTLSQGKKGAELTFRDSGCGMTPEVLENMFEPFFTRSRTGKGTGLGLSISQRIVTQHGGEIEASSGGAGKGSTFVVRLPFAPAAA